MGCLTINKLITLGADQDYDSIPEIFSEIFTVLYVASFKNFAGSVTLVVVCALRVLL